VSDVGLEIARRYVADGNADADDIDADDVEFMAKSCVAIAAERDKALADVARLTITYDNTCSCALADATQPTLAHAKDCPIRVNKLRRLDPGVALDRLAAALHSGDEVEGLRTQIERMTARAEENQRLATKVHDRDQRELVEIDSVLASAGANSAPGSLADSVRGVIVERDAYRAMVADLLASASPHPTEHPTMARQWKRARELLENGPSDTKKREPGCQCHQEEGDSSCPVHLNPEDVSP
jgi:hypothetical protein